MARSAWKPCAVSHVSSRRLFCLMKAVHARYKIYHSAWLYRFLSFHRKNVGARALLERYVYCASNTRYTFEELDIYRGFIDNFFEKRSHISTNFSRRYFFTLKQLRGSFKWLITKVRPKDRILRFYRFMRLRLKLKGGYKISSRNTPRSLRRRRYLLFRQIRVFKYYTDRRFGEFITTRVRGYFRKNKDKAKIKKLKKDMAKARRRQKHQIAENARIWKKVLQEAKGKGKSGKVAKKTKGGRRKLNK